MEGFSWTGGRPTAEQCAAMVKIIREIEGHMQQWVSERGPDDSDEPDAPKSPFLPRDVIFERLAAADPRFTIEAYRLVDEAVFSAIKKAGASLADHVSGGDVCNAFRMLAILHFRKAALPTLHSWGIRSTDDVGALVFRMIDAGFLGSRPEDKLEDFHALYDFTTAFPVV